MSSAPESSSVPSRRLRDYLVETGSGESPRKLTVRSLALLSIRAGVLLTLYLALEWWLTQASRLPPASYEEGCLLVEFFRNLGAQALIVAALAVVVALHRPFWFSWFELEHRSFVRALVVLAAGVLAWVYSTYDFNLYLGRAHPVDRLALVLLVVLIWWRPVFVLPFVLLVLVVAGQFWHPLGGYSLAQPSLLIRILIVFVCVFALQVVSGTRKVDDFVFWVLVLIASAYFKCGLGKLKMDWVSYGHIYHLLFATYANGWLAWFEPETVTTVGRIVSWFDWPMRIGTLMVECGALFFLWSRRGLLILLTACILFHLSIFTLSGILFWNWIVLEALLVGFFLGGRQLRSLPIFTRPRFVLSIVLIAGGVLWFKSTNLTWLDSPLSYTYRLEGIGEESARRYRLCPAFFSPYDYQFTLGPFSYLSDQPQFRIVWGGIYDRAVADSLLEVASAEEIRALEEEKGRNYHDEAMAAAFDRFVARFVANFNACGTRRSWWSHLQPPRQLWTFPKEVPFVSGERIRKVVVIQVTTFHDGELYSEIRRTKIREIEIPR